ncbi:hypothetical protein ACN47E_003403 [Coniothyrium glycines]
MQLPERAETRCAHPGAAELRQHLSIVLQLKSYRAHFADRHPVRFAMYDVPARCIGSWISPDNPRGYSSTSAAQVTTYTLQAKRVRD